MVQFQSPIGIDAETTAAGPPVVISGDTASDQTNSSVISQTEHVMPTISSIPMPAEQSSNTSSDFSPVPALAEHDAGLIGLPGASGSDGWWWN